MSDITSDITDFESELRPTERQENLHNFGEYR